MMQEGHIPQEDLVLYAMQAMRSHELAAVRVHLDQCAECRQTLSEVNGDLALVAMSIDPVPLPQGARERFLAKIASHSPAAGSVSVTPIDATPVPRRPARSAALWIGWLAAAASLFFAFSLQQKVNSLNGELAQQQKVAAQQNEANARAKQVLEVLTAPTASRVMLTAAKAKPEPTGRAVYLADTGGLVFQANALAQLAEDKAYELWVIPANGQAPIPAGVFRPDAAGSASVFMPPLPKGVPAKAFGVTIERAEGSATPTAPIILVGAVPSSGE